MTEPLFVYGTLRDPDLLAGILNRRLSATAMLTAAAPGFRAVHYPNRPYPALVRAPGQAAPGLVLTDLSPFERDLLDAFEGPEYRAALIPVMIDQELHEAFAYLPTIAIPPTAEPWTLETWVRLNKTQVLDGEFATADELRTKLIAIRPH